MTLTVNYFQAELLIPGIVGSTYAETENLALLNRMIKKYEPLYMEMLLGEDLYAAYRHWCAKEGIGKPAQSNTFLGNCAKREGATKARKRHYDDLNGSSTSHSMLVFPPGADPAAPIRELTES